MEGSKASDGQLGIANRTFQATWATGAAAALTALGVAGVGIVEGIPRGTEPAIVVALLALVGVAFLAFALVVSTDIRARASVDVASLQFTRTDSPEAPPRSTRSSRSDGGDRNDPPPAPTVVSVATPMGVTVGEEIYKVLAIRVDPTTEETRYLVAQPGSLPRWRGRDELDNSVFTFNDQGFPESG